MGHPGLGRLLEVVGGQAVILGAHEVLEVAPGVAGDALEEGAVLGAEREPPLRHGPAQGVGDERRGGPQREHRHGRRERGRTRDRPPARGRASAIERARDHLPHERRVRRRGRRPRSALAAAVSHSSMRRCVAASRTSVRPIACTLSQAWFARNVSCRPVCANAVLASSLATRRKTRHGCCGWRTAERSSGPADRG